LAAEGLFLCRVIILIMLRTFVFLGFLSYCFQKHSDDTEALDTVEDGENEALDETVDGENEALDEADGLTEVRVEAAE